MRLILQLIGPPRLMGAREQFELRAGSFSVGRSPEADWTISDTERLISRKHMRIDASHGEFVLTDTSANGVYVNDSPEPIGYGASVGLRHGDRLRIGEAEIAVSMDTGLAFAEPAQAPPPATPFVLNAQSFAEQIATPALADPLGGPFGRVESKPQAVPPRMVVGADWMNDPVAHAPIPASSPSDQGEAVVLPIRGASASVAETVDDRRSLRRVTTESSTSNVSVAVLVEGHPELSARRLAAILDAAGQGLEPHVWIELFTKIKSVMNNDAI